MADMDVLHLAVTSSLEAEAHRHLAKIPFQHNCMRVSTKTGGTLHSHGHLRRMRQIHQTIFCFRRNNEQCQRCSTREGSVRKSADFYSYTGTVNCTAFARFKSYKGVSRTLFLLKHEARLAESDDKVSIREVMVQFDQIFVGGFIPVFCLTPLFSECLPELEIIEGKVLVNSTPCAVQSTCDPTVDQN